MTEYDDITVIGPPPSGPLCDFCSYPHVEWTYPCRDHKRADTRNIAFGQRPDGSWELAGNMVIEGWQGGGWAACNVCHALIERGNRDKLARRSARRVVQKLAQHKPPIFYPYDIAVRTVRTFHDDFWANRTGPAVKTESTTRKDPTR